MEGGGGGACVAWWVLLCAQSNKGGQGKPARSRPFLLSRAPNKTAMVRRGGGGGGFEGGIFHCLEYQLTDFKVEERYHINNLWLL